MNILRYAFLQSDQDPKEHRMITLRDATLADTPKIVALNDAVVEVTSPMGADRFEALFNLSSHCTVAEKDGVVIGFVLAMQSGDAYENANFDWFSQRLNNFVYIDRIVIAKAGRGHGLGCRLYAHVAEAARKNGCLVMCAEMDLEPPNEHSLKFHKNAEFVKLGEREYDTGKVVSMQLKGL